MDAKYHDGRIDKMLIYNVTVSIVFTVLTNFQDSDTF